MRRKQSLTPYLDALTNAIGAREPEFRIEVKQVNDPAEPEAYYWHLYHHGQRINGGLVEGDKCTAEIQACVYRARYTRSLILASHAWDGKKLISRL